ncbi:MAG: LacI family DNA-binding transcriptional regulator [Bacteroidales bacterium]|nr:LacI family DNA-binding transcriptional regulator [Bacteroidales bacterium]MDD4385508.1 LacI family DNA-binding transcriptional regulator [Bacteroidales bacterium]MDY0198790.1 LacI family DNA-binding transcriptional regulator [Tenuifilaceae bacterium]
MSKKISLADIADCLGVSKTLVSLVLNGKGDEYGINQQTQKRVIDKAEELSYTPNVLAQGFRTGKTKTIGLIVSDISNPFYSRIARRIEDYAWDKGYSVIICSSDESIEKEIKRIKLLQGRKVDGLIISSSQENADSFNLFSSNNFPHVLIDRCFQNTDSPCVTVENTTGAQIAAKHLLEQGIKDIALLSITPEHISTITERTNGFLSTLAEEKVDIPEEWHIKIAFTNIESEVEQKLTELYKSGNMPRAIFALNNNLTSHCLLALRKLNISIPNDIALVGFDDMLYFGFTQPSVSAVNQPIEEIGEKAFDLLLRQINGEEILKSERNVRLPVNLIIRESSTKTQ